MSNRIACRWSIVAILAVLVPQLIPTASTAQVLRAPLKPHDFRATAPHSRMASPRSPGGPLLVRVAESEPNDSIPAADAVALGDTISGSMGVLGDVDFFRFELTAGTRLVIDVDAAEYGSSLDPIIALFAPDGVTQLAFSDDWDGLDSHIDFNIPVTGRYYAGIMDWSGSGGAGYTYALAIVPFLPPHAPLADVANAFLGVGNAVSLEMAEYLDFEGNGNGRLDVADFRTYLRTIDQSAVAAGRAKP